MVIRRRLRQKLEFVSEDLAAHGRADGGAAQRVPDARIRTRSAIEPRYTFRQVFLDPRPPR